MPLFLRCRILTTRAVALVDSALPETSNACARCTLVCALYKLQRLPLRLASIASMPFPSCTVGIFHSPRHASMLHLILPRNSVPSWMKQGTQSGSMIFIQDNCLGDIHRYPSTSIRYWSGGFTLCSLIYPALSKLAFVAFPFFAYL